MRRQAIVATSVFAMLAAGSARGTKPEVEWVCPEKIKAVCDASKIPDNDERRAALLRLLPEALQSPDHDARQGAARILATAIREIGFDPTPLRGAISEFDRLEHGDGGTTMLDQYELEHAPREARLRVYMTAIVDGRARYGGAYVLDRLWAMVAAAREGMGELRALIEQYQPGAAKDDRSGYARFSLEYLLTSLELRDGAQSADEAALLAAQRLDRLPADDLWAKFDSSEGWRRAFWDAKEDACKDAKSEACAIMRRVCDRVRASIEPLVQAQREERMRAYKPQLGTLPAPLGPRERQLQTWLGDLTPAH